MFICDVCFFLASRRVAQTSCCVWLAPLFCDADSRHGAVVVTLSERALPGALLELLGNRGCPTAEQQAVISRHEAQNAKLCGRDTARTRTCRWPFVCFVCVWVKVNFSAKRSRKNVVCTRRIEQRSLRVSNTCRRGETLRSHRTIQHIFKSQKNAPSVSS